MIKDCFTHPPWLFCQWTNTIKNRENIFLKVILYKFINCLDKNLRKPQYLFMESSNFSSICHSCHVFRSLKTRKTWRTANWVTLYRWPVLQISSSYSDINYSVTDTSQNFLKLHHDSGSIYKVLHASDPHQLKFILGEFNCYIYTWHMTCVLEYLNGFSIWYSHWTSR